MHFKNDAAWRFANYILNYRIKLVPQANIDNIHKISLSDIKGDF